MTYPIVNRAREVAAVLVALLMMPALGTAQAADGPSITDHEFTATTTRAGYPYMAGGVGSDERATHYVVANDQVERQRRREEEHGHQHGIGVRRCVAECQSHARLSQVHDHEERR